MGNRKIPKSISYRALVARSRRQREAHLLGALRKAKVRMQTVKAPQLARNVALIEALGGVKAATRKMLALDSYEEKLRFARSFHGIGEKYGRNVWMDIYDRSFRDRIAVDYRLKRIARALGFTRSRYCESEALFQAVAVDAGMEPWELDRLLYCFTNYYVLATLGTRANTA